jgi:hypothetical protein
MPRIARIDLKFQCSIREIRVIRGSSSSIVRRGLPVLQTIQKLLSTTQTANQTECQSVEVVFFIHDEESIH